MNKFRGFTLVEMLIVIVIIGILIATFAPKLTGTQSTARDTGRKANLQTVGAALIKYQLDEGNYPTSGGSLDTIGIDEYLDYKVPGDPQKTRTVENCDMTSTPGQYLYVPLKKNGLIGGGLAIIASVEEDGAANRVTGTEGDGPRGCITQGSDYKAIAQSISSCDRIKENNTDDPACSFDPAVETLRHVYIQ